MNALNLRHRLNPLNQTQDIGAGQFRAQVRGELNPVAPTLQKFLQIGLTKHETTDDEERHGHDSRGQQMTPE